MTEYHVIDCRNWSVTSTMQIKLNNLAQEDWKLVCAVSATGHMIFEREKKTPAGKGTITEPQTPASLGYGQKG